MRQGLLVWSGRGRKSRCGVTLWFGSGGARSGVGGIGLRISRYECQVSIHSDRVKSQTDVRTDDRKGRNHTNFSTSSPFVAT